MRRKYWDATVAGILLIAAPLLYIAAHPWGTTVPFVVVGVGAAALARAVYLSRRVEQTN